MRLSLFLVSLLFWIVEAQIVTLPPNSYTTVPPFQNTPIPQSVQSQLQSEALTNFNLLSNSTTTIAKSITIPARVAIIEVEFDCGRGCTAYSSSSVTVGSSAKSTFSVGAGKRSRAVSVSKSMHVAMENGHEIKDFKTDVYLCHQTKCKEMKAKSLSAKVWKRVADASGSSDLLAQSSARRKLNQFDAVAFGMALYAVTEVKKLWASVNALTDQVNNFIDFANKQFDAIKDQEARMNLAIQQVSLNTYLLNGKTALNTAATSIRLYALDTAEQHIPGWMAVMAAKQAQAEGLEVPIAFDSPLPDYSTNLQNSYIYYGLIDDDPVENQVLNFQNPCSQYGVYRVARIQEGIFPWGYSMFLAVEYAVWPKAPTMLNTSYQQCFSNGRSQTVNGACFLSQDCGSSPTSAPGTQGVCDPNAAERARRVAFLDINFQGYAGVYSTFAPLSVYTDKQAFLNAFSFTQFGFTGPLGNGLATAPPQCPSNGPTTAIQFPANPALLVNSTCIDPAFWTGFYTNSGSSGTPCSSYGSPIVEIPADSTLYPMNMPNPSFVGYPSFFGQTVKGFNGINQFRTIGVSNETIALHYLVQQQNFYFNSSQGISRAPTFIPEWRAADGRSPPDALVAQMEAIGLTAGFKYDPNNDILAPFSYIPAVLYTLGQDPGDYSCFNAACLINTGNYIWDPVKKAYGAPYYTELIAPVGNPVSCYPSYDCTTVGQPAQKAGISPKTCPANAALCCNSVGYPCFIQFNGTDSNGITFFEVINASIPNFDQAIQNAAFPPPPVNYDAVTAEANAFANFSAQLSKKFPHIVIPGDDLGGFADFIGDVANAAVKAASAVENVAEKTLDHFGDLFFGTLGAVGALFAWMIPVALAIGVILLIFCCFQNRNLFKIDSDGFTRKRARFQADYEEEPSSRTVRGAPSYENSRLVHPASYRMR